MLLEKTGGRSDWRLEEGVSDRPRAPRVAILTVSGAVAAGAAPDDRPGRCSPELAEQAGAEVLASDGGARRPRADRGPPAPPRRRRARR